MTRDEHVTWCKQRALKYVEMGDMVNAYASMVSDLAKHPETAKHPAIIIGIQLMVIGQLSHPDEMRRFIEGFH